MAFRAGLSTGSRSCGDVHAGRQASGGKPNRLQQRLHGTCCRAAQQPADDLAGPPMSLGVPITSYSNATALKAVSTKSFACTMCGKCCTLAEDAEVTAGCCSA